MSCFATKWHAGGFWTRVKYWTPGKRCFTILFYNPKDEATIAQYITYQMENIMGYKKFLVPVTAAIAALFSNTSQAVMPSSVSALPSPTPVRAMLAAQQSADLIVQKVNYYLGTEEHVLLMQKDDSGLTYARHGSHHSHRSHRSHGSHRSGY